MAAGLAGAVAFEMAEERLRICGPDCWRQMASDLCQFVRNPTEKISPQDSDDLVAVVLHLTDALVSKGDQQLAHIHTLLAPEIAAFRAGSDELLTEAFGAC